MNTISVLSIFISKNAKSIWKVGWFGHNLWLYLSFYNSDLKARKTTVAFWRVGNIHIIHISLIIELKMSVIRKPVVGFKNRWQVRTKNFLKGLIWYAWGLWQAFLSDFIEFWWKKIFIKISKHSEIALWTKNDFLLISE